jgi:hypothetical protein
MITKVDGDLLVDADLLSYVKEQLALLGDPYEEAEVVTEASPVTLNESVTENISRETLDDPSGCLENISRETLEMLDIHDDVFVHDRVKVYWPSKKTYFFGEVLQTDDSTKGSHKIRYENNHQVVYAWLTGPQPANWDGPMEKFSVLSQRKRRNVDYCESNKKRLKKEERQVEERQVEKRVKREKRGRPRKEESLNKIPNPEKGQSPKKKKKSELKAEQRQKEGWPIETEELFVLSKDYTLTKDKILTVFNSLKKKKASVTLTKIVRFLKRELQPESPPLHLKSKLLAWITKYDIFVKNTEQKGTRNLIWLSIPKNMLDDQNGIIQVDSDSEDYSESLSESDEVIYDIFS